MKKFFLVSLILFVISTIAYAQPAQQQVYSRIRDATNPANVANVGQPSGDSILPTGVYAADSMGFEYCFDGDVVAPGEWDRLTCGTPGAIFPISRGSLKVYGPVYFLNLSTLPIATFGRWSGGDVADATSAVGMPWVENFNMLWDNTNSHWDRQRGDVNGAAITNQSTTVPGYGRIQDGDSTILADVEDTNANGKALTLNPLMTAAVLYVYNGATLDMGLSGPTGGIIIDVSNWPTFVDDGAGVAHMNKKNTTANYATEGPTAVAAAFVTVLAARDISSDVNWCVYLKNAGGGGAGPIVDATVQVSPDNAVFITINSTFCDGITSGNGCVYCVSESAYRYVRVQAQAAAPANDTTVTSYISINKG